MSKCGKQHVVTFNSILLDDWFSRFNRNQMVSQSQQRHRHRFAATNLWEKHWTHITKLNSQEEAKNTSFNGTYNKQITSTSSGQCVYDENFFGKNFIFHFTHLKFFTEHKFVSNYTHTTSICKSKEITIADDTRKDEIGKRNLHNEHRLFTCDARINNNKKHLLRAPEL